MPGAASQHGNCLQCLISTDPDISLRPAGKCASSQVGMLSSMAHVQPIGILCTLARIRLPRLQIKLEMLPRIAEWPICTAELDKGCLEQHAAKTAGYKGQPAWMILTSARCLLSGCTLVTQGKEHFLSPVKHLQAGLWTLLL